MRHIIRHAVLFRCIATSVLIIAFNAGAAAGGDRTLQAACFAPEKLQAMSGEKYPVKGDRDFDKPAGGGVALAPVAAVPAAMRGSIRRVELPKGEKLVALTFDLCEQRGEVAGYDGDIFDYLRRENVHATLFAGGKWMRSHEARTQQLMTDPLFEIANHSETHRNLRLLGSADVTSEITGPQSAYVHARQRVAATQCAARAPEAVNEIPPRPVLFRFPFGACNAATMTAVNDAGLLAIQWDISAGDPDPHQTAPMIANALLHRVKPGSIIVAHGNGRGWNTAAALPLVIPKLKALGYSFVTVSELLARGKPVIADSCYDSHPGDTDRYDFLGGLHANAKRSNSGKGEADSLPWAATTTPSQSHAQTHSHASESTGHLTPSLSWPF
jgi:peptidoglycan-N-acetylglucosamine deacetylase